MKERMLTVLVPILDEDALVVEELPVIDSSNVNVIYKHEGVYKRLMRNPTTNRYEYQTVVDREFPYVGKPMEIFDFTYDATRMGSAPTISAQNVMWYADKDGDGNDVTLEDLFYKRSQDCHVRFDGKNYYLLRVPTCSKDDGDARYKYNIDFISEDDVLSHVYLYDVVRPFITERPISENSVFSFFGDVSELVNRINASLLRSGLSKLELRDDVSTYLTYEQFNSLGLGTYPFPDDMPYSARVQFRYRYYVSINGDYSRYLRNFVFKVDDGDFVQSGYVCKIGNDKSGRHVSSEEKLITFDDNTIHEALQKIHDTFGLQYYITKEKDSNGEYTGNTLIVVADCEHDFADVEGEDFVRDADGIPTTEHPFDYGVDNELLSKEKTNTTDKIITRITGTGSSENIPWYYPNPTADGWIKPVYKRNGEVTTIEIEYPKSEGGTYNVLYEKYLKNRLGDVFRFGKKIMSVSNYSIIDEYSSYKTSVDENVAVLCYGFQISQDTRIYCNGFACAFEGSSVSYSLFKDDVDITDASNVFLSTGGVGDLTEGNYVIVFTITFSNGGPSVSEDVQYYFYNEKWAFCNPWKTWSVRMVLNILTGVLSLSAIRTFISGFTGFQASIPAFLSTNPNLTFVKDEDATILGWYDGDRRIDKSEMIFGQRDAQYYVFRGGEGQQSIGHSNVYLANFDKTCKTANLQLLGINPYNWDDSRQFFGSWSYGDAEKGFVSANAPVEVDIEIESFINNYISYSFDGYIVDGWYSGNRRKSLSDFGILGESVLNEEAEVNDTIEFQRVKYVTPQPTIMPELYIKTDGERRFYDAHNYDPVRGSAEDVDALIGEEYVNRINIDGTSQRGVINKIYSPDGDGLKHYDFENEYLAKHPHEHIEQFEDIKPTIKGQINTVDGRSFRVDVIEEFAYDELDDDEIWESNDGGNISGEYKHPYFFAKLRPLGFNLFDLALQDDMVLSMTTGHCGACNFRIGVDENTKKNPVQIWEYDVYEGADYATKVLKYHAGELRRYVDISNLYYDKTGTIEGYTPVTPTAGVSINPASQNIGSIFQRLFRRTVYSANMVKNGEVGALKQENKSHFAGDVMTSGRFIESQQDTSDNYVWVALMKDTDSYGVIMPSAKPDYADGNYSVYIRPKSFADTGDEEKADKFVLTNIRMPQIYLRRAERELSRKLVEFMYDNNYQKFNFHIGFSRIFLAQNQDIEDKLNENSVLYVSFNNRTYRQYVKHYTYRMSKNTVLPEITVDMNEELSVSRTRIERDTASRVVRDMAAARRIRDEIHFSEQRIGRRTIGRNSDTLVGGNIVNIDASTSFNDLQIARMSAAAAIADTQIDLEVNHFKKSDFAINGQKLEIGESISVPTKSVFDNFVSSVNTFNAGSAQRLNQIKETIEHRLPSAAGGTISIDCPSYKFNHNELTHTTELLWYNSDGSVATIPDSVCSTSTNMTSISWENFETN